MIDIRQSVWGRFQMAGSSLKLGITNGRIFPIFIVLLFSGTLLSGSLVTFAGCAQNTEIGGTEIGESHQLVKQEKQEKSADKKKNHLNKTAKKKMEIATFGNGCYWCTEAVFQRVKGVNKVTSGFMGGKKDNPTYEEVCAGTTGHAEVLHIEYDPEQVSYEKLLQVFWKTHDPTTLNRQGNDVGTQYRSAVFYHDDHQKQLAEKYKKKLDEAKAFDNPIVTEITKASKFYSAPDYHQNYYNLNKHKNAYCGIIQVKLDKFRKAFGDIIDDKKDVVK